MRGKGSEEILYGEVGKRGEAGSVPRQEVAEPEEALLDTYKSMFSDHEEAGAAGDWELQSQAERDITAQLLDDLESGRIKDIDQAQMLAQRITKVIYI